MSMRPFWRYYGGKWRMANNGKYPRPLDGLPIIEPFAGAAGYSTVFGADRDVILFDTNPDVVAAWKWLIAATPDDVLDLPDIEPGQRTDELGVPAGAEALIGFWLGQGNAQPRRSRTERDWAKRYGRWSWGPQARRRLARQVPRISAWTIVEGDYTVAPAVEATWFIDPPYQGRVGEYYGTHGSQKIEFDALGQWCRRCDGAVIVCENAGAAWLPFRSLVRAKALKGYSEEAAWFGGRWADGPPNEQLALFRHKGT